MVDVDHSSDNATSHKDDKKLLLVIVTIIASILTVGVVVVVAMIATDEMTPDSNTSFITSENNTIGKSNPDHFSNDLVRVLDPLNRKTDIVMPTKVSRPGCEVTDSCYLPSTYDVSVGEPITWTNNDSAFHSVTSGTFDAPMDMFDSGFMDPYDSYTLLFIVPGTYQYYCTLHPWMEGTISVYER